MTTEHNRCKDQRAMCWKLFKAEIKAIVERLHGMDKALEKQSEVLEYRLEALNELREEFTRNRNMFVTKDTFDGMDKRVVKLETRSVIWITLIGIFFAILQVVLRFWN